MEEVIGWSAIWWVVTSYVNIVAQRFLPIWTLPLICWKCWTFIGTLLITGDIFISSTASLLSAVIDLYLSSKRITL